MYVKDSPEYKHHIDTYGKHTDFGYKDFIPMFKAEKFDPKEWAELFRASGAKYVVPVAEHHDGFQMYRSEISHWNAYEMGPHRDVLGELKTTAVRLELNLVHLPTVQSIGFYGRWKKLRQRYKRTAPKGGLILAINAVGGITRYLQQARTIRGIFAGLACSLL